MHTFSICIPTKNRASTFLPDLLKSIEGQILPENWLIEIVICDDGSGMSEKKLLYDIVSRLHTKSIVIEHNESLGIAASRNSAVEASTGELISDIDDDDILLTNSIANRIKAHQSQEVKWTYGNAIKIDKNLRYKINKDIVPNWNTKLNNIEHEIRGLINQSMFYCASTRTYRRDSLFVKNKLIEWDPNFIVAEDLEHWIRMVEISGPPTHIDTFLIAWREKQQSSGIDGRRSGIQKEMINMIKEKHSKYNY